MSDATRVVAIDGPAGAGKSSTAKAVASALGIAFLDTGAMYRAATWRALHHEIDLDDGDALLASTQAMDLDLEDTPNGVRVTVDGQDVSDAIRTPEVTNVIFKLDQNPEIRKHLVELQRRIGEQRPVVAEGRDIGTVVFPKARCKVYMDADLEERAKRRAKQMEEKGATVDFEKLCAEIRDRDEKSMNRADSPLRPAEDAILLDTTHLDYDQVVTELTRLARERLCL